MNILPDTGQAVAFLKQWNLNGPWTLTAIPPDGGATQTSTFTELEAVTAWIEERQGKMNLYFAVNPLKEAVFSKAKKSDVAALAALHVDIDPRLGEDLDRERLRISKALEAFSPRPSLIINSGGGYQAFWRLAQPEHVASDADISRLESYNIALARELGGDNCHNLDRIMRLPGTINLPNAKKRNKGRIPVLAKIAQADWTLSYSLEAFKQAEVEERATSPAKLEISSELPSVELEDLPVSNYYKTVILHGLDPDNPHKHPSRSEWLFGVCCAMARAECSDELMAAVILNPDFKISGSVLDKPKPREYAARQIQEAKEEAIAPELRELNAKHFVVKSFGSKFRIATKMLDHQSGLVKWDFQSHHDFKEAYRNREIVVGRQKSGAVITKKLGEWWLEHPQRREYDEVVFAPAVEVAPTQFNLWQGFAFSPSKGNLHQSFLTHVLDNICNGDEKAYYYLLRWMARAVQTPASPGDVAVVLIGEKGTGKGQFADHFGKLFGPHYKIISHDNQLTGKFNAHLQDCIVLLADEVTPSKDSKQDGVLKNLITAPTIMVEHKGVNAVQMPNYIHIIMASNSRHAVYYTTDERRYLVLGVGSAQKQNRAYFAAITQDLQRGGYANLLYFLQNLDLSDWNHTQVPVTKAAQEQLTASADKVLTWLLNILREGVLPGDDAQKKGDPSLMCLGLAASELEMPPQTLRLKLMRMGVIIDPNPVQRKVFVDLNGEFTKNPKEGQEALPRRMYRVAALADLRKLCAIHAPEGWPDDGNVWRLSEEVDTPFPF